LPSRPPRTAHVAARLFVDSGAWLALRSQRDQHHVAADRAFRTAIEARIPLVTTNLVLAELHRLTLFRAGYEAALRALERIQPSSGVSIHFATSDDHSAAREWLERLAPRPVTYTDAISFAVIRATKCTHVLGFDEDFAAAGFELWREAL
jgi:predicted nucleic acid-binding protein